jgi:V-type H+-transporting ATPase subunit C
VKNVSDLLKKEDFVLGSEYLQTIVLAVPKLTRDEFLKNYERLTQMVVPRSAKALVEDDDYVLYAVVVFKRVIDEFNAKAREYKCIPRDFVYDEQAIADEKKELSTAASSAKEQRVST